MPTERHTAVVFIETWQKARSLEEAAKNLGLSRRTAASRASRMRSYGVPLKSFGAERKWEELAELARSMGGG